MPVPTAVNASPPDPLPTLSRAQIEATRTSAWYDKFEDLTIPTRVIDIGELDEDQALLEVSYDLACLSANG